MATPIETAHIIGRTSSHYTRLTRIFAHELGIAVELTPVYDMLSSDAATYGDNPARKMPTLKRSTGLVFGAENICRTLAEMAGEPHRIVWPEEVRIDLSRNAQEMVWHAMAAQTQMVFGVLVNKLPADNVYFAKGREGFVGALGWLDTHLARVLAALPARDLSLFEIALFALVTHLQFRVTVPVEPYRQLLAFADNFAARPSAQATQYAFDRPP
jgi:glutathione S-transferase